jgi:multidrug efflux pump subunit AcrA (membrane-fusion protein)
MKLRHILIIAGFLIVNVLIVFVLMMGGDKPKTTEEKSTYLSTLTAKEVLNVNEEFSVEAFGNVSSFNSVDVSAEMQGKLTKGRVDLKPGMSFRKGELLFKIYDVEAKYAVKARKSTFITLMANILPDVKNDYNTEYQKWDSYVKSIDLDKSLPTLPNWKSDKEKVFLSTKNILSEYYSIKSQEEQLKKYYAYAPFSGTITEVYVNDNSFVNPGSRVIKIVQTSNYEIAVSVPANRLGDFKKGTQARIFTTDGVLKGAGSIVRISEVLNTSTQSVDVFVKIKPLENQKFINGEYLKVELAVEGNYKGVRVPSKSIKDNTVYVYNKQDSMIVEKSITVLNDNVKGVFVSGLVDKDILITQEVLNHQDSIKYNVIIKKN